MEQGRKKIGGISPFPIFNKILFFLDMKETEKDNNNIVKIIIQN